MIRVLIFLGLVAVIAVGAAWLADRPGEITIAWPWLGQSIELPLSLVIEAVALLIGLATLLQIFGLWLLRRIWRHRALRPYRAISRGLIAIGAGDLVAARRFTGEARRLAPDEPLALLLAAQTAQLTGDRAAAEAAFRRMADHAETRLFGLHGLFIEAQRRSDAAGARQVAEAAVKDNPASGWAAQAVLEFRCMERDWAGALAALDSNMKSRLIDKPTFRRRRAVLLTARALSGGDRAAALADVSEAVRLAPELVPAAALAGRLLAEAGKMRRASRIIETAWRVNPHPDLAVAYTHVRYGDSARDRLARVETLARLKSDDPEGKLAVARAAIDAREFVTARGALAPLIAAPTQRVALMMAELEEYDTGDIGRARQWMARAVHAAPDPAWTADGLVSEKWLPVSPATGRLDAFQWKVPVSDLDAPTRVIDLDVPPPAAPHGAPPAAPPTSLPPADRDVDLPSADGLAPRDAERDTSHEAAPAPASDAAALPVMPRRSDPEPPRPAPRADDVIPLVHSPDDPGPDAELVVDPIPVPPTPEPWWRRSFFR